MKPLWPHAIQLSDNQNALLNQILVDQASLQDSESGVRGLADDRHTRALMLQAEDQAIKARRAGLNYRMIACQELPAVVASTTTEFEIGITGAEPCQVGAVVVGYRGVIPASAAGAITLDIRKIESGVDSSLLAAPIDLETLVLGLPSSIALVSTGSLAPLTWIYGQLISTAAIEAAGSQGIVKLCGLVKA